MEEFTAMITDMLGLPPGSVNADLILKALQTDYVLDRLLDVVSDFVNDR